MTADTYVVARRPAAVLPVIDLAAKRARRRPAASQCGECVEGGYGPPCLKHFLDAEAAYERGLDV